MATVILHPFGSGPVRNRANAPRLAAVEPQPELPAFWGSLVNRRPATEVVPAAPKAERSSAVVGGLWIQIR